LLETLDLQEHFEESFDCLERIRQSEFWARVLAAGQRLVEVPFGHRTGKDYLFGIVDLALSGADGWSIVDYKTDRKRLEDLVASYARQVNQYAESWAEVGGQPVDYAGIFGVREGRLTGDLRNSLDPLSEGSFDP
jgi:ATP-dependent exoDNAse (exonuclease V) beta subunit